MPPMQCESESDDFVRVDYPFVSGGYECNDIHSYSFEGS